MVCKKVWVQSEYSHAVPDQEIKDLPDALLSTTFKEHTVAAVKLIDYEKSVAAVPFGKRLPNALYVHRDGQQKLGPDLNSLVTDLATQHELGREFNIQEHPIRV